MIESQQKNDVIMEVANKERLKLEKEIADLKEIQSRDQSSLGVEAPGKESPQKSAPKIMINDKTMTKADVLITSPKNLSKDSPEIKEGFARLTYYCQVEKIAIDNLGQALFGKDFMSEKITLGDLRTLFKSKLKCSDQVSICLARYLFDNSSSTEKSLANQEDTVLVELKQRQRMFNIAKNFQAELEMAGKIVYFGATREGKMKLILGEKFSTGKAQATMLGVLSKQYASQKTLTWDLFKATFEMAQVTLDDNTTMCAFIYLLKNRSDGKQYYDVLKSDLEDLVNESSKTATMKKESSIKAGKVFEFPKEDELTYSVESESEDKTYKATEHCLSENASAAVNGSKSELQRIKTSAKQVQKSTDIQWVGKFE